MRIVTLAAAIAVTGCHAEEEPPVWPGADLEPCATTRTSYVIDAITVPTNADLIESTGRDLDGDGTVDNALGNIIGLLTALRFEVQDRTDEGLAADALLIGLTIEECADPAYTLVELHRGVEIDRTVDPPVLRVEDATELAAVDRRDDTERLAVQGQGTFPPTALFEAEGAEWIPMYGFEVVLDEVDALGVEAHVAGGVDSEAFHDAVVPVMHRYILSALEGQPGCPEACEDDGLDEIVDRFDTDGDFEITLAEVDENDVLRVFGRPDLDLLTQVDGVPTYWPGQDGDEDSLSVGLAFHASLVEVQ